jgi:shikimate kinase
MQDDSPMSGCDIERAARSIVLVGIMGAGKSAIGRRLAQRLALPFVDADDEIEAAAGCTIEDIFARYGEAEFRKGEEKVLRRLMRGPRKVLATGGGAFVNQRTRQAIKARGVSVWLRADLETLMRRVGRRNDRPMLKGGNPRELMAKLMESRYPIYAEADLVVDSTEGPHDLVVQDIAERLGRYLAEAAPAALEACP